MSTTSSSAVIYSFLALHQSHSGLGNPRRPFRVLSFLCKFPYAKAIPLTTWGSDSKSLNIKMFFEKACFFYIYRYYHFYHSFVKEINVCPYPLSTGCLGVFKGHPWPGGTDSGHSAWKQMLCFRHMFIWSNYIFFCGKLKFRQTHHTVTNTTVFDFLWLSLALLYYFRPSLSLIWGAWTTRWSRQSATSWVWPFLPMIASASTFAASRKPRSGLLWWYRH